MGWAIFIRVGAPHLVTSRFSQSGALSFFSQIRDAEKAAAFLQSYARVDGDPRASSARAWSSGGTVQA